MTRYDEEPFITAAEAILMSAPAVAERAVALGWIEGGDVDWQRFMPEWECRTGAWSSGEQDLVATVAALGSASVSGLDSENWAAVASALRAGAAVAERRLSAAQAGEALIARLFGECAQEG
jgi:hypothetical protein